MYEVPSTMVTGFCGILSVMAWIFSSVSSSESNACSSQQHQHQPASTQQSAHWALTGTLLLCVSKTM
jgi:hypothetical protein